MRCPTKGRRRRIALALLGAALMLGGPAYAQTEAVIPGAYEQADRADAAGRADATRTIPDFPVWRRITLVRTRASTAARSTRCEKHPGRRDGG